MENKKNEKRPAKMLLSTLQIVGISIASAVVAIMFCYTYSYGKVQSNIEQLASADVFRIFEAKTFTGESYGAEDIKSTRLTVLNVWATTCPPCIKELPDIDDVSKDYDPSQVRVVGLCKDVVSSDGTINEEKLETAKQIIADNNISYTQIYSDSNLLSFTAANVPATPMTFFIDHEGNIVEGASGSADYNKWKQMIDTELSKLHD